MIVKRTNKLGRVYYYDKTQKRFTGHKNWRLSVAHRWPKSKRESVARKTREYWQEVKQYKQLTGKRTEQARQELRGLTPLDRVERIRRLQEIPKNCIDTPARPIDNYKYEITPELQPFFDFLVANIPEYKKFGVYNFAIESTQGELQHTKQYQDFDATRFNAESLAIMVIKMLASNFGFYKYKIDQNVLICIRPITVEEYEAEQRYIEESIPW